MRLVIPEASRVDASTDEDLLIAIAAGDADDRRQAANAFFRRYVRVVFAYCNQTYRHTIGEDEIETLVSHVFYRAYERAHTYKPTGGDSSHPQARTTKWLTRIADRVVLDWLKSTSESVPLPLRMIGVTSAHGPVHGDAIDLEENLVWEDADADIREDESPFLSSEEARRLQDALASLTQREREILILSYRYEVPGRQLDIDADELDALCTRWGTTRKNVRAIRRRALTKVRERCINPS